MNFLYFFYPSARVLLDVEQKAAKKRLKAANISCDM
jgi:hypothetical protein